MNYQTDPSMSPRVRCDRQGHRDEYVPKSLRPAQLERFKSNKPPLALVITCTEHAADSALMTTLRSEPLLVWQIDGHVVPPFGERSTEADDAIVRAIDEFGVPEIVICGHLPSAKIQQFVDRNGDDLEDLHPGFVRSMNLTRQIVQQKYGPLKGDPLLRAMAEENIFIQLANLRSYPSVIRGLAVGDLELCAWLFDAGRRKIFGHEAGQSRTLRRIKARLAPDRRPSPFFDPCDVYLA